MDLIYTNAKRVDQGVVSAYDFDLSFGAEENDYEITLGADEPMLEFGAFVYVEGTEYGGIVDGIKSDTNGETVTYMGRTWHGIINSKVIQPNSGADYLVVSGDANVVLADLISRLGLSGLFAAKEEQSRVSISNFQFPRYCKGYDGIRAMLAANNAKLKVLWESQTVLLSAEPIVDYTADPVDGDIASLTVEQHKHKVNHLICLGAGELAEREVIHLYVDQFGRIGDVQYYTGIDEVVETYDYPNSDDLRADGFKKLTDLRNNDTAEITLPETEGIVFDIGDVVGATEIKSGVKVTETVTQKIIRIKNGIITADYNTGGSSTSTNEGGSSFGGGGGGYSGDSELPVATQTTLGGIKVGENLGITGDGLLSVLTADSVEEDNTRPITAAAVHTTVGNIEVLLSTI